MFRLSLIFGFCLIQCADPSPVQSKAEPIEPLKLGYKLSHEIQAELDSIEAPWKYQNAATHYSYIGQDKKTFVNYYRDHPIRKPMSDHELDSFMQLYQLVDAVDYILKRSQKEQVVIVNEAHHKPKHRVFTSSLLQGLYDQGFRHLGLETLSNRGFHDSELNQRKYPVYASGTYTREPQFGNMIREALEIGFTIFPYEGEGNNKPREINQARNIANYMAKHPGEKILIHCGYQHAQEGAIKGWGKAMAGRLLEFTGVNPLTVNQTIYDNRYDTSYMSPLHQRLDIDKPSVMLDSNGLSFMGTSDTSGFDIIVFHEKNRLENGRNAWLVNEERSWVEVDLASLAFDNDYLLLAIPSDNDINQAVPLDLLELKPGMAKCHLALKPGNYQVIAQNKSKAYRFDLLVETN